MNHLGYWSEFRKYLVSLLEIDCKWDSIVWFLLLKKDKSYPLASLVVLFKIEKPPTSIKLAKFAHLSMNKSILLFYTSPIWLYECCAVCFLHVSKCEFYHVFASSHFAYLIKNAAVFYFE